MSLTLQVEDTFNSISWERGQDTDPGGRCFDLSLCVAPAKEKKESTYNTQKPSPYQIQRRFFL